MERLVGATIAGKYRVRRVLGSGSMGVVCEAMHVDIGKRVAIKLISASLAGMDDVVMRFRREARAASLIESNHIVQVFDVGQDDELGLYLVMEYLVGEDLAKVLAREKRLDVDTAVRIAVQVARGLARAHEAGVVHRDLKPANIFLCKSEDDQPLVKVLDFGISKLTDSARGPAASALKLTRDGMVVGTPQYMSPEQAQGYPVDHRSDIWALGLVLYEMLAGRPAYPELPSYERFIIHLVSAPPDPLREVAPWVSEEIAGVVHGALEHDLGARIGSAAEVVRRLMAAHPARPEATRSEATRSQEGADAARLPVPEPQDTLVMKTPPVEGPSARAPRDGGEPRPAPAAAALRSSGVRGAASDASTTPEDFEQDAPQFFDRKLIAALGPRAAAGGEPAVGAVAVTPAAAGASDDRQARARRQRMRWLGLVLVAVGLTLVAALAHVR